MELENVDEIELCQNVEPHEVEETVKSKAVVKFAQVQAPVKFNRLECNTNLNLPPSNWLTSADNNYGLQQALYHNPGFASFRMAHMFPDCVGEVDVVADAENIKKLLKLPYAAKGAVSMTVHKVGNTLLLDEFDIQKYLLRKADDDWNWLRTFIMEQILAYGDGGHSVCLKDKSREAIQTKNLLSKFLYYSLKQSPNCEANEKIGADEKEKRTALPITGPLLPEPKIEENVPDPNSSHVFQRNVVWTFEDIRMLIGTDMPIFGGPNRPCISLRLRDMAKPINVLTGIDYWLDNLMCNVPEVVMCYHLDGIVQKYEIIKTEDLPYLEDSQFSPQLVKNVAQNILSFLKANATKEGHTYWLFKGRNDDVVKLYDLTTLCKNQTSSQEEKCDDDDDETQGNPFTVPVAMLLYTVARNMKNRNPSISPKTAGNIRALLDNCIKLLPKEKYPQIVTSSHYILSDLHIPAGIDPKDPKFDVCDADSDTQSVYEEEDDEEEEEEDFVYDNKENVQDLNNDHNVAVQNICDTLKEFTFDNHQPKTNKQRPSPLIASVEERCSISLEHINQGLSCLQFFNKNEESFIKESEARAKDEEKARILHEEQNPNMAKPFKPIPLPYESLKSPTKSTETQQEVTTTEQSLAETKGKKPKMKKSQSRDLKPVLTAPQQTSDGHAMPSQQIAVSFNSQLFGSWNIHLKLLLLEKACLTYATLAEYKYVEQRYGLSLRYIYMACKCQHVVLKYVSTIVSQKRCLLGRAGDCLFQMAKNWENIGENIKDFHKSDETEKYIEMELEKELEADDCSELIIPQENIEHLMVSSCACYENALELVDSTTTAKTNGDEEARHELLRRLGNVRNELGVKYMFWSQEQYSKHLQENSDEKKDETSDENKSQNNDDGDEEKTAQNADPLYLKLAMKSYDCLVRGIKAFGLVEDNVNMAFLYCNMGRFMRFRAHLITNENIDVIQQQKRFYNEAFSFYEKAQDVLGSRKSNPELWDLVNWELSTATFTLAKQLQDCSSADETCRVDLEKEVLDLLQKSLKLCDVEHPGARQVVYTYRSGLIHQRIASFHHSQLRNNYSDSATLPKPILQLCKYHYEKAAAILDSLREASDYLVVQLERISLQEFLTENSLHNTQKIKHLQQLLDICLNSKSLFEYALSNWNSSSDNTASTVGSNSESPASGANETEFRKHILLFESRLQNALKTLIKLLLNTKDPKQKADLYKKMYMETLNIRKITGVQNEQTMTVMVLAQQFANLLERLTQLERIHANNLNNNNTNNGANNTN
ncbi:erythroid differentiation-related factor 1 [Musca vetustissima]|uniref:erythroid differentiation-related factor 1 n=1 Tax=Musca vetustissima TaxID=27455 RepID=UPI002AB7CDA4|nr:erythroid differentiation-related factor 1 [Musca vetustissima]